jgi:pantetheine-phosphate adenylyltransferase
VKALKRAIYPGTFDPITYGHLDIVNRGLSIFDEIIIAVAADSQKKTLFTVEERIGMIQKAIATMHGVSVESFEGLLVRHIEGKNAHAIIRGLREVSDFEYEFQMALMNRKLNKNIETIFLMSNEKYTYLTSSIVKEVAFLGGNVKAFVPPHVSAALKKRMKEINGK